MKSQWRYSCKSCKGTGCLAQEEGCDCCPHCKGYGYTGFMEEVINVGKNKKMKKKKGKRK